MLTCFLFCRPSLMAKYRFKCQMKLSLLFLLGGLSLEDSLLAHVLPGSRLSKPCAMQSLKIPSRLWVSLLYFAKFGPKICIMQMLSHLYNTLVFWMTCCVPIDSFRPQFVEGVSLPFDGIFTRGGWRQEAGFLPQAIVIARRNIFQNLYSFCLD